MTTPLEPGAALEQAVVDRMQTPPASGGLGYARIFCGRQFDGRPPPLERGLWYASVWSDGAVQVGESGAARTSLDESISLFVTVTCELPQTFDRRVKHRDFLSQKANAIVVMIHRDVEDQSITNAANALADLRRGDLASGAAVAVGFVLGLSFKGADPIAEAGGDWCHGTADDTRAFVYQKLRFGGIARVQNLANME